MGREAKRCIECGNKLSPRTALRFDVVLSRPCVAVDGVKAMDRPRITYCASCAPPELLLVEPLADARGAPGLRATTCIACVAPLNPRQVMRFEVVAARPDVQPTRFDYCADCAPEPFMRRAMAEAPDRPGPVPERRRRLRPADNWKHPLSD